ncbi:HlyD family type I secretion periplasmic adaptor subunit [Campylobacter sp. faydin G-24]|uniref:HlyD family type I secretion periplasmic adaptor subunit n=1 Tax=Campylobacter anatolicus TaxID=2829105 RepID=A0ABS5HLB6_9BACT|nr:HlyD family type I secretion periplasmic adaptor subunit [Campylobacter anatolicus]MBR8464577.1 HlyD family type I secretion periplasmic adaptor subunit [Campylobacter anatolicus]
MSEEIKNNENQPSEMTQDQNSQKLQLDVSERERIGNNVYNAVKDIRAGLQTKGYDSQDLKFMSSLSEAVLAKTPSNSKKILYTVAFTCFWLILWASYAEIDEITRGNGKIIPSGKNQAIQNLEGGIVEAILVKEGDEVKKDQVILRLDNKNFSSSYGESKLRLDELQAKFLRLDAEANDKVFEYNATRDTNNSKAIMYELSLYHSNMAQLDEQVGILSEQIRQRQSELNELYNKISQTQTSYNLMLKEKDIMDPIFKKGLVSEVEYLQLQRQLSGLKGELDAARLSVPRVESTIKEAQNKITESKLAFKNNAKKELNEVSAEIARINESQINLSDRVERTYVRSPVNGIVSKLMVHTVSGVIKPGESIAEIVPLEDKLVAEVKVKPADVAFLRPGLPTVVKFTAYDFSIYGGLDGNVTQISADTETDEKTGESYYLVRIETEKNYLGSEAKPLRIKVGMIVSADIITGKKTILDYLLKPILKAKHNALTER